MSDDRLRRVSAMLLGFGFALIMVALSVTYPRAAFLFGWWAGAAMTWALDKASS